MSRFIFVILGIIVTSPVAAQVTTTTTAAIVSWNIEGFGGINDPAKIDRLAEGIVFLDPDVIGIQEVNPAPVVEAIVERANSLGASYAPPVLIEQEADLNLAILHKTGVSVTNPRLVEGSDLDQPGLRKALAADVRVGQFDFTLIVVHLKSGRGAVEQATRAAQAAVIHDFIRDIAIGGDDDVLVVGDYNMIPDIDREGFDALNPDNFLRVISTYYSTADFSNVNGNFLDGFAITRNRMTEYVEGSFQVYPMHKVYKRTMTWYDDNVSDHFPLIARFRITRDAD